MFWVNLTSYCLILAVAITAAWIDLRTGKVFNRLTYPAIVLGMLFWSVVALATGSTERLADCGIALLAAAVPYTVVVLMGALGGGDLKLMVAIGVLSASWQLVLATSVYALLLAAVFAVVLVIRHGLLKQTLLRLLTGQFGKRDVQTERYPTIPFAVAIAVAVTVAGAEFLLGWQSPWAAFGP
ncbi:MAG: A24 family peptidase [Planctomycetota bacterium]